MAPCSSWLVAANLLLASISFAAAPVSPPPPGPAPESPAAATATAPKPRSLPPAPNVLRPIRNGMSTATVLHEWGPPADRQLLDDSADHGVAERWTYSQVVGHRAENVPTSTRQVPVLEPLTGETRLVEEPVYTSVRIDRVVGVHLLFIDDRLTQSKSFAGERRDYQN